MGGIAPGAYANFTCEGRITYLGLGPTGLVTLNIGFGTWYICDQTSSYAGYTTTYSVEGCKAWYAAILAAQKAGHSLRFYFPSAGGGNNGPECSALGTWVAPNPSAYHMTVMDQ